MSLFVPFLSLPWTNPIPRTTTIQTPPPYHCCTHRKNLQKKAPNPQLRSNRANHIHKKTHNSDHQIHHQPQPQEIATTEGKKKLSLQKPPTIATSIRNSHHIITQKKKLISTPPPLRSTHRSTMILNPRAITTHHNPHRFKTQPTPPDLREPQWTWEIHKLIKPTLDLRDPQPMTQIGLEWATTHFSYTHLFL